VGGTQWLAAATVRRLAWSLMGQVGGTVQPLDPSQSNNFRRSKNILFLF
jgi:hypothetical protein